MKHVKSISRGPAKAQDIPSVFEIKAEFIVGFTQRVSDFLFNFFVG